MAGDAVPGEDVAGIDPAPKGGVGAEVAGGLPGRGGGGGRRRPVARQAGVPGAWVGDRAQASGGDADQAPSGWWGVAGWSRSPRVCSPALLVWPVGCTTATDAAR